MKKVNLDSEVINQKKKKDKLKDLEQIKPSKKVKQSKSKERSNIFKKLFQGIKNIPKWYKSLSLSKKIIVSAVVLIITAGAVGSATYYFIIQNRSSSISIPEQIKVKATDGYSYKTEISLLKANAPKDTPNPINGELYTAKEFEEIKSRSPIAVMVENHIDARPQSGYNKADIVYETLAEGGITRTMPVFWGKESSEIGPVRSARMYYVEWMLPYDALFMHIGYAISSDARVDVASNVYKYGVKTMNTSGTFWRSTDKYAPHNAYTSSEKLYNRAKQLGYAESPEEIESWTFKKDATKNNRGPGKDATIIFFERLNNGGIYDITWKYDRDRNIYLRNNYDTPYIDGETNTQVYAKNVIIQRTEMISTFDSKAHIIITTIGSGDAQILKDGKVIDAKWEKKDIHDRTTYVDKNGEEIEFNRGIIWVEAVPIDQGTVQIED